MSGSTEVHHAIDRFSFFRGTLYVAGWVLAPHAAIASVDLILPSGSRHPLTSFGLPSPDVAAIFGPGAAASRFADNIQLPASPTDLSAAALRVSFRDATAPVEILNLGAPVGDAARALVPKFGQLMRARPAGRLLEVGSRARSGVVRRELTPPGWDYSGLDVMAGPNVDVVGDAHRLSSLYPAQGFAAVMAFSVLEHLLMPWKFVIELNRVLSLGAVGLFTTHQAWPLHDQPWDFWRFSDRAWSGLLNDATGFEIIEARMGEPCLMVAAKWHPAVAFDEHATGQLASSVLFRKIAETDLDWPVTLESITTTEYPPDTTDVRARPATQV